ncbi:DUF5134 domain-containing protein [Streptomyces sp. NPDC101150]|uniref:DUF5134 domain-containing protein n=1 Tax=Streptomyces sp. NPDC101150 TaxID=3366114 RepID=UPI003817B31A
MHGPPLVGWLLVLLCGAAGAYCLAQARTGTAARRGELRGEGLMGLGMAVMALPASAMAAPAWSSWLFAGAFGAMGLWALARRHVHHAVGALAMVYMALAMVLPAAAGGGVGGPAHLAEMHHAGPMGQVGPMSHAAPGGLPLLTVVLLAYYTVFVIAAGLRLAPAAVAAEGPVAAVAAGRPAVIRACRVAMGIAMLAMLLTL